MRKYVYFLTHLGRDGKNNFGIKWILDQDEVEVKTITRAEMSELQGYIEDALENLNSRGSCEDSLQKLDSLLGQLCILSNRINLEQVSTTNTKTKTIMTKTQKSIVKVWKVPCADDVVFGQFVQLQDNFQYNVASHIMQLLAHSSSQLKDEVITLANNVLQGCLLLHPPSRALFKRQSNMNSLLVFLRNYENYSVSLVTTVIQTFVCLLVRNVPNLRVFEILKGPELICHLFNTCQEKSIKHKALEFLMFYLIPETNEAPTAQSLFKTPDGSVTLGTGSILSSNSGESISSAASTMSTQPSSISGSESSLHTDVYSKRRTMEQKADRLRPHLVNVEALITQFTEIKPFGKLRHVDW